MICAAYIMCIKWISLPFNQFYSIRLNYILQKEILSVNFTPEDPGELIGGSRFKPVDHFVLPKVSFSIMYIHIHEYSVHVHQQRVLWNFIWQECLDSAKRVYQGALDKSRYCYNLAYVTHSQTPHPKRNRQRHVIWYNLPITVETWIRNKLWKMLPFPCWSVFP